MINSIDKTRSIIIRDDSINIEEVISEVTELLLKPQLESIMKDEDEQPSAGGCN